MSRVRQYLKLTNEVGKGYTFTGKVDYLYQLIAFIAENTAHLSDEQVVDQIDPQARLDAPRLRQKERHDLSRQRCTQDALQAGRGH